MTKRERVLSILLVALLICYRPLESAAGTVFQAVSLTPTATTGSISATGGATFAALAVPVNGAFSTACTGGSLNDATTFFYRVTAINISGETLASTETSQATGACSGANTSTVTVTWGAVAGATGYNVYGRTTGAETKITNANATTLLSYTDTGSALSGALPGSDSTANISGVERITSNAFISNNHANPASSGSVRLPSSDAVVWRNNANSADVLLGKNASDQLTWAGAVVSVSSERDWNNYNAGNLASATAIGETTITNASTITTASKITQDVVGVGGGNFVVMACTDGTTCAGGNQRATWTEACAAAVGTRTAATIQNSGTLAAGTVLTLSVTTACATTDPGANINAHMTTP